MEATVTRHKLVRERDHRMNSDRALEVTDRGQETKQICLACRRVPDEWAMKMAWYDAHKTDWGYQHTPWPGLGGKCPDCQGQLVSVSW